VDLDGTLLRSDLLHESFARLLLRQPLQALQAPWWLVGGKARLKQEIGDRVGIDAATLPYHEPFLAYLRQQRDNGRRLVLATASDRRYAQAVATHLGLFDAVLASDGKVNCSGSRKLAAIQADAGGRFAYAGNDHVDVVIWGQASAAVTVNAPPAAVEDLRAANKLEAEFNGQGASAFGLLKALRPHQWLKNLLVFLPLLPIATLVGIRAVLACVVAFMAFSLCASVVYLVNDLSDLDADRRHPRKRERPFASGRASMGAGLALLPALILAAALLASQLPAAFAGVLLLYLVTSSLYTFVLKRHAMVDVITLAGLYTLRVLGGAAAIAVKPSFWILAFSMFIFLSLALSKRAAELATMRKLDRQGAAGRGYQVSDLSLVQTMGVVSGYLSALVMALYLNTDEMLRRYHFPELLWGVCPLILLWVSRLWLKTERAEMHDDPMVFALRDRFSRWTMALAAILVLAALVI
jgi:4-hydroxybenzoate polyprenyltransferase